MSYRVFIADDEQSMREGLLRWIRWDRVGFTVAGTFADGKDLIAALDTTLPEVILTDIKMTFVSGLEIAEHVHARSLDTRVVLLSAYQDFEFARRALRHGVVDYLLKPISVAEVERLFGRIKSELDEAAGNSRSPEPDGEPPSGDQRRVIITARRYIDDHLAEDISLESVAGVVGLSPEYLSRLFKQEVGMNYVEYLVMRRVEQAKTYLRDPTLKIYEVSHAVGYRNEKYFARVFRNMTGISPTEYRELPE